MGHHLVEFVVYRHLSISCAHPPQSRASPNCLVPHGSKPLGDTCWSAVWLWTFVHYWLAGASKYMFFSIPTVRYTCLVSQHWNDDETLNGPMRFLEWNQAHNHMAGMERKHQLEDLWRATDSWKSCAEQLKILPETLLVYLVVGSICCCVLRLKEA